MLILSTDQFLDWLQKLRDRIAQRRIAERIARARDGNLGKMRSLGEGLMEMKIDHGPGYRVYFTYDGPLLIVLLVGGDKSSQDRDIHRAREVAALKEWRE